MVTVGAVEVAAGGVGQCVHLPGNEADGDEAAVISLKVAEDLKEIEMERVSGGVFDHPGPTG